LIAASSPIKVSSDDGAAKDDSLELNIRFVNEDLSDYPSPETVRNHR